MDRYINRWRDRQSVSGAGVQDGVGLRYDNTSGFSAFDALGPSVEGIPQVPIEIRVCLRSYCFM